MTLLFLLVLSFLPLYWANCQRCCVLSECRLLVPVLCCYLMLMVEGAELQLGSNSEAEVLDKQIIFVLLEYADCCRKNIPFLGIWLTRGIYACCEGIWVSCWLDVYRLWAKQPLPLERNYCWLGRMYLWNACDDHLPRDWITWFVKPLTCSSVVTPILSECGLYRWVGKSRNCARSWNNIRIAGYYIGQLSCFTKSGPGAKGLTFKKFMRYATRQWTLCGATLIHCAYFLLWALDVGRKIMTALLSKKTFLILTTWGEYVNSPGHSNLWNAKVSILLYNMTK